MKYKTFLPRLIAIIVDGIILSFVEMFWGYLVTGNGMIEKVIRIITFHIIYYGYFVYAHSKYGQTIGKAYANIKVVSYQDESRLLNIKEAIMRDIIGISFVVLDVIILIFQLNQNILIGYISLYFAYVWLILELTTMIFSEKKRSVHDLIANSVVINLRATKEKNTN